MRALVTSGRVVSRPAARRLALLCMGTETVVNGDSSTVVGCGAEMVTGQGASGTAVHGCGCGSDGTLAGTAVAPQADVAAWNGPQSAAHLLTQLGWQWWLRGLQLVLVQVQGEELVVPGRWQTQHQACTPPQGVRPPETCRQSWPGPRAACSLAGVREQRWPPAAGVAGTVSSEVRCRLRHLLLRSAHPASYGGAGMAADLRDAGCAGGPRAEMTGSGRDVALA